MFNLLVNNIKDRLNGNKAKANARLGLVSAPEGTGKIVWIVAGDSCAAFIMAASLLAAIREKRQDIRLVLTYETEYQDVIVQYMSGVKKIGFGYHCGDNAMAAKKMIKRLSPFAVIFVGEEPKASFTKALTQYTHGSKTECSAIHKIAFQFTPKDVPYKKNNSHFYEACYPTSLEKNNKMIINENCKYTSKQFNVLTRIVQQQVDKQLGGMLCKALDGKLFHAHNANDEQVENLLQQWCSESTASHELSHKLSYELGQQLLVLSYMDNNGSEKKDYRSLQKVIEKSGFHWIMLSQWDQNPIGENTIVIADEQKWYAAICASSIATHLYSTDVIHWWQSLASGAVISVDANQNNVKQIIADGFDSVVLSFSLNNEICDHWITLLNNPVEQRKVSDATRKLFWAERREAETQVNEFLQRVYDW